MATWLQMILVHVGLNEQWELLQHFSVWRLCFHRVSLGKLSLFVHSETLHKKCWNCPGLTKGRTAETHDKLLQAGQHGRGGRKNQCSHKPQPNLPLSLLTSISLKIKRRPVYWLTTLPPEKKKKKNIKHNLFRFEILESFCSLIILCQKILKRNKSSPHLTSLLRIWF